eukprot:3059041-Rhodomonas_salina.3
MPARHGSLPTRFSQPKGFRPTTLDRTCTRFHLARTQTCSVIGRGSKTSLESAAGSTFALCYTGMYQASVHRHGTLICSKAQ